MQLADLAHTPKPFSAQTLEDQMSDKPISRPLPWCGPAHMEILFWVKTKTQPRQHPRDPKLRSSCSASHQTGRRSEDERRSDDCQIASGKATPPSSGSEPHPAMIATKRRNTQHDHAETHAQPLHISSAQTLIASLSKDISWKRRCIHLFRVEMNR